MFKPTALFVLIALALIASPASARPKKWHRRHVDNTINGNEIKDADNIFTQLTNEAETIQTAPKVDSEVPSDNGSTSFNLSTLLDSNEDKPLTDFQKLVMDMLADVFETELDKAINEMGRKKLERK